MSFKDILSKLDQLSEATQETEKGRVHKAEPGGYGRKYDTDEEGDEKKDDKAKKADAPKRGRGRPKKGADDSGEVKKYDFSAFGVKHGKDVKLPKYDKSKVTKHSLKEYIELLDEMMTQQPIPVVGKQGDTQSTGAGFLNIDDDSPAGQAMKDAIGKMAQQKKAQIVMPTGTQQKTTSASSTSGGATNQPAVSEEGGEKWIQKAIKHPGSFTAKAKAAGKSVAAFAKEKADAPGTLGKQARLAMTLKKMHEEMNEADLPPQDGLMGAGLGAGRSQGVSEESSDNKYSNLSNRGVNRGINRAADDFNRMMDLDQVESPHYKTQHQQDTKQRLKTKQMAGPKGVLPEQGMAEGSMDEANIQPSSARSRSHIGNLSNPRINSVVHPSSGKEIGIITKQPNGEYSAMPSSTALAYSQSGTFATKDEAHQFIRNAHAKAMKNGTLSDNWLKKPPLPQFAKGQDVAEGKKPDFPDIDDDGNTKEPISKAAQDAKKDKKKVKEGMEHRLKAAHHRGKAHALAKESYNSKYDDMEEARMYHEGYKEGLDECYGQIPIRGQVVGEEGNTVDDMASFGAHTPTMEADIDEMTKTQYMKQQAIKTPGDTFKAFGQTMHDKDVLETDSMFESWDNQLGSLLDEYQEIQEGLSVSVSKGQQGAPDSVTVSAQDADADKLLQLVKHAGLGLFGDEMKADVGVPSGDEQHGGVNVVGDHDGMMALMKKMSGDAPGTLEPSDSEDYKDEEGHDEHGDEDLDFIKKVAMGDKGEHAHEEKCNECGGAMEEGHSCGDKEMVDEVESEDQMEYEVAEDNAPDSGAEEFAAMDQEIAQDNAAASSHGGAENSNIEEENEELEEAEDELEEGEEIEESYANANDDSFQTDIDFMTKIISGGLNKEKSTGQTTIPVIAGQSDRMGYSVKESLDDWKKLAGM